MSLGACQAEYNAMTQLAKEDIWLSKSLKKRDGNYAWVSEFDLKISPLSRGPHRKSLLPHGPNVMTSRCYWLQNWSKNLPFLFSTSLQKKLKPTSSQNQCRSKTYKKLLRNLVSDLSRRTVEKAVVRPSHISVSWWIVKYMHSMHNSERADIKLFV